MLELKRNTSPVRRHFATPGSWSRSHRAGFATIHRRTWRRPIAGRPPAVLNQFPPFENCLEQLHSLLHRAEEFRPVCHDPRRPEEFSQVLCRSCLARQELRYKERQKRLGPWCRCWRKEVSEDVRQNWPNAASGPRPGYRDRLCTSADRWQCRACLKVGRAPFPSSRRPIDSGRPRLPTERRD